MHNAPSSLTYLHCDLWSTIFVFNRYDGHGGVDTANYLQKELHRSIICSQHFPTDLAQAVRDGCARCDAAFLDGGGSDGGGSTAVMMLVVGGRAVVANVGDSEAILSSGGRAVVLSKQHRPDDPGEKKRIEDAGGFVVQGRVCGILGVSRAFGDIDSKVRWSAME